MCGKIPECVTVAKIALVTVDPVLLGTVCIVRGTETTPATLDYSLVTPYPIAASTTDDSAPITRS